MNRASHESGDERIAGVATTDAARTLRALAVVERVAVATQPVSVPQLASWLDIPKASMARLVTRLVADRYLVAVPGERSYVPGPRLVRLGFAALGNGRFRREVRAVLRGLVARLGETCNLAARDGDRVVLVERVESEQPLRLHLAVGSSAPLHCTAGGKLFLASLPRVEREATIDRLPLEPMTGRTLVDRAALACAIDALAGRGVGIDDEEFVQGMVGVAVAVPHERERGNAGTCVALVCHAASARMSLQALEAHLPDLRRAANELATLW